jgi:hypothetical protein
MKSYYRLSVYAMMTVAFYFLFKNFSNERVQKFRASLRSSKCGSYPGDNDLVMVDGLSQYVEIPKGMYKLTASYVDKNMVNIALTGKELDMATDLIFCQVWFEDSYSAVPKVIQATEYKKFNDGKGKLI